MKEPLLYRIARPIIKALFMFLYRPKIVGLKNTNIDGGIVLAGNHTKWLDPVLIVASTNRQVHFLAKDSLMKGFKKIIFKNMGIIPVNRKIKDKSVLEKANNCLNNDMAVVVFPEGTINRTNDIVMPFKIGAVKMAHDTASPLIPFIITGKYKLFGGVKLEFLPPIIIKDDLSLENEKLTNIIKDNLERNKLWDF